jgi:hypothetical protein
MGDTLYFKAYVKLADGSYVYSIQRYYSAKLYADIMLADKTASTSIKALCVALMNYGAAAQNKFDYNTGNLMNADLTAEQKALVKDYSADMLADVVMPGNKVGALVDNGALSTKGASVNFGGAFAINYNFVTAHTPDAGVKLYVWDKATFESVETLTLENASKVIDMTDVGNNGYTGRVSGISAKNVEDSYYACAVYTSGGITYCSGILPLSVGAYCEAYAAAASDMQALAQATCVYSYYARVHILGA